MRRCEVCGLSTTALVCPRDGGTTVATNAGEDSEPRAALSQAAPKVGSSKRQSTARHSNQASVDVPALGTHSAEVSFKSTLPGAVQMRQVPLSQAGRAEDLPKIWDAPGSQDDRAIKRDTKPLPRDQPSAARTGAGASESSSQSDPLDELIQSYVHDGPNASAQPTQSNASTAAPAAQDARRSGGWGDELFGEAGRDFEPRESAAARAPQPHAVIEERQSGQGEPEIRPSNESNSASHLIVWSIIAVMIVSACALWAYLLSQNDLPPPTESASPAVGAVLAAPDKTKSPPKSAPQVNVKPQAQTLDEEAEDDKPNLVFRARLSPKDHISPSGDKLTVAWKVLVRDRDRFHLGQGDPEDTEDSRFRDEAGRKRLIYLLKHRRLSTESQHAIKGSFPLVEVRIWDDQVTVEVLGE